ncbi:MAG: HDOD domain-containing protein, partial [candidate division Zixibacteria bacterium]|nr:HDOD domain-containing protein [candidate division Zixibacteria bacterium]
DAIIILGFHTIRSLVLASSVRGIFKSQKGNNIEGILWEHSLATAISCRMVAERLKHPGRDEAFLCGILHDIGKLILFRKFPDKYMEIFEKAPDSLMEFHELEQDMLGFDHMEVGEALLNKWNFPNEFVTAVVDHHRWIDKEEGKPLPLSWIVNYSNLCSGIIGSNIGNPARCETQWLEAVDRLGFVPDEATEVNNMLFDLFTEEKKIYD